MIRHFLVDGGNLVVLNASTMAPFQCTHAPLQLLCHITVVLLRSFTVKFKRYIRATTKRRTWKITSSRTITFEPPHAGRRDGGNRVCVCYIGSNECEGLICERLERIFNKWRIRPGDRWEKLYEVASSRRKSR